jgi:hypothetical protein
MSKNLDFLMFFTIISLLADFERYISTDLFVEYFCEFLDTPGVPGGVLIVELEKSGLFLLPNTYWTQTEETSHCGALRKICVFMCSDVQ